MAEASDTAEFDIVDVVDEQPKRNWCTVVLHQPDVRKKLKDGVKLQQTAQSVCVTAKNDSGVFRFEVRRLPCEIDMKKTSMKVRDGKVELKLRKAKEQSWAAYSDEKLETSQ